MANEKKRTAPGFKKRKTWATHQTTDVQAGIKRKKGVTSKTQKSKEEFVLNPEELRSQTVSKKENWLHQGLQPITNIRSRRGRNRGEKLSRKVE